MQDIRWSTFWFFVLEIIVFLIISNIYSIEDGLIVCLCLMSCFLLVHIFWVYKLSKWLNNPTLSNLPHGTGIWQNIFSKHYQILKDSKKSKKNLVSTLDQFTQAAEALMDGVVVLNENNEIIWSNRRSQVMLNLNSKKDTGQPINYIFRNTDLINYLEKGNYEESIKINLEANSTKTIEIKIVMFGGAQKVLIAKDIGQAIKIESERKEFISNVSHELKTPLTVISGFIETLEDMFSISGEKQKNILKMMGDQAYNMSKLIDDLLLLSNVESSIFQNRSEKLLMNVIISKIKKNISILDSKRHRIKYQIDNNLSIYGSKKEIESAFLNLITNAIRYTDKDGFISISWGLINGLAIFEVRDTGCGIKPMHINKITERFYRVDADRSRNSGGTGLGLSIVKNIIKQHDGQLKITSEVGKGSSFKLIFNKESII
ncbi:phosphate regulon sensor histidine kinase PhoR [Methylophilaceae bacterium]|nr:phosphate regulon sensor histidine kinase PhoR [Methylophilaceae bacterium]